MFASALWTRHPYRLPELGTADAVASLSRRRLMDHYRRYYGVAGLTIAVVGNVVPARVAAKIQSLLGDGGPAPETAPIPVEPARGEGVEVFRAMPADDAQVVIGYPGTTLRDPDRFSLEVLAEILSGPSGRLAEAFRDQRPFVRGSSARSFAGIDPGSVAIAFACRSQNLEPAVAAARAELARVVERGVTADEVGRARRYLIGAHAVALEPRSAIAAALASGEVYGQGPREFRRYGEAINRITPADVQRVARKFIDPRREVVAVVRSPDDGPAVAKRRDTKSSDDKSEPKASAAGALKTGAARSSAP
jgi:zinc protease